MENLADIGSEPEREPSYMFYNAGWVLSLHCRHKRERSIGETTVNMVNIEEVGWGGGECEEEGEGTPSFFLSSSTQPAPLPPSSQFPSLPCSPACSLFSPYPPLRSPPFHVLLSEAS